MLKIYRTTKIFTDSNQSDKAGFGYFVEWSFQNPILKILTLGWWKIDIEFPNEEKALQYCNKLKTKGR